MRLLAGLMVLFAGALTSVGVESPPKVEFGFQFREGLLWVSVTFPQSPTPLNFLLDSGAGVSVVNLSTAKRLGLKLGERASVRGVQTTTTGFWLEPVSATIGNIPLPKNLLAIDLCQLSEACHCPIDGLLGNDFFRGKVVQIDFAQEKIRLFESIEPPLGSEVLPLAQTGQAMRVPIRVNGGRNQWVRLDTGCASALQWVTRKSRASKTSSKVSIGLAKVAIPQTTTTVLLGNEQFESVPTGLHQTRIFPGEDGILGNGLLARFARVILDAKAARLILESSGKER